MPSNNDFEKTWETTQAYLKAVERGEINPFSFAPVDKTDTLSAKELDAFLEERHCPNCNKNTKQSEVPYNPNDPILGYVWQCNNCNENLGFVN